MHSQPILTEGGTALGMAATAVVLRCSRERVGGRGWRLGLGGALPRGRALLACACCCGTALTDLLGPARAHFMHA